MLFNLILKTVSAISIKKCNLRVTIDTTETFINNKDIKNFLFKKCKISINLLPFALNLQFVENLQSFFGSVLLYDFWTEQAKGPSVAARTG